MKKIYQKQTITTSLRPFKSGNVFIIIWEAVLKRKIMLFSMLVLLITLPILYLIIHYQPKVEAAWIEKNISRRMTKGFFSGASLNKSRQSYKKKEYYQEQTGNIEKKKSGISLIKVHNFRLNKIAIIQQVKLVAIPNANTCREGLSREGIKIGTTRDPKNRVPIFIKTSANLSNWLNERMGNFTVFNISKNDTKIIDSFQGIT